MLKYDNTQTCRNIDKQQKTLKSNPEGEQHEYEVWKLKRIYLY